MAIGIGLLVVAFCICGWAGLVIAFVRTCGILISVDTVMTVLLQ